MLQNDLIKHFPLENITLLGIKMPQYSNKTKPNMANFILINNDKSIITCKILATL